VLEFTLSGDAAVRGFIAVHEGRDDEVALAVEADRFDCCSPTCSGSTGKSTASGTAVIAEIPITFSWDCWEEATATVVLRAGNCCG
jgi:hypothetical protein